MGCRLLEKFRLAAGVEVLLATILLFSVASSAAAAGLEDAKRGLAELVRGNFEHAVLYNTRAIDSGELEPESLAVAYYNRASGYLRLDQREHALEDFKKAYGSWPQHPMTRKKMREFGLLD